MHEQKIKDILENQLTLLKELEGHLKQQIKAIDEDNEQELVRILDAKEPLIESWVNEHQELEKCVDLLDEKNRIAIAKSLKELGAQIETETEKINEMENECEKNLMNEKLELFGKMKSLKNGRILLKGYGMSTRIKPKFKGSI